MEKVRPGKMYLKSNFLGRNLYNTVNRLKTCFVENSNDTVLVLQQTGSLR